MNLFPHINSTSTNTMSPLEAAGANKWEPAWPHALAYIPTGTTAHTLNPKPEPASGAAAVTEVPYLQREFVCRPPNPVLGLHAVLPCQGHSGVVETPVFLSFQLQDEDLQRAQDPGVSASFLTIVRQSGPRGPALKGLDELQISDKKYKWEISAALHPTLQSCHCWFSLLKTGNHEPGYWKVFIFFTVKKPHWVLDIPPSPAFKSSIRQLKAHNLWWKSQVSDIPQGLKSWISSLADRKTSRFLFFSQPKIYSSSV